ncbi:hypothetical protein [Micromonospora sp. NBC_01813]|uniref:hypothetical protein n=1 Tax=Micromonospora sp. NBC_01813 TaxID=2975988 RepID=UPI002DD85F6E|nr:hypothetical protein [Micromonospora sp. NBC_01813]WSA09105.1 hypothetical protein OG958_34015 [Micromonospora sp. NBC_01813]
MTHDPTPHHTVTVVTCPRCDGNPTPACARCDGAGTRRAQFVLTVANLDTAAVASATIVPGSVTPTRTDDDRAWCLDLAPVVAGLATQAGAAHLYDPELPDEPIYAPWTELPAGWQPDLPAHQRHALEAGPIAAEGYDPWRIWYGHTTPPPPADPARRLGELCDTAELLCLDLVIEARRSSSAPDSDHFHWDIRYELPDSPVPTSTGRYNTFTDAATRVDTGRACFELIDRSQHAPAHHITPRPTNGIPLGPPPVDADQLERRIVADCTALLTGAPTPGAHAIWRDGRWWHTTLRPTGTKTSNGRGERLARSWQPPPPSWQGPPIPHLPCPDCTHLPRWEDCDCDRIGGCRTCAGSHRIYHGATVTISAGRRRVRHLNWPTPTGTPEATPPIGTHPGGKPIHQLPPEYQLTHQLTDLGLDPTELATLDGQLMFLRDHELLHGYATVHQPDSDPVTAYLEAVTNGHPGGRILLHATPPQVPPLATVVTLAHRLGLAAVISLADHRHNDGNPHQVQGLRWGVCFAPPGTTGHLGRWNPGAHHPSLPKAIAHALEYIRNGSDHAVPADPTIPVPAPHHPNPDNNDNGGQGDDPVPALTTLAARHPGLAVTALLTPKRCEIHLPNGPHHTKVIATATTLTEAVARTFSR